MNQTLMSGLKHTTARREWWGWFGASVWMYFMMYGLGMYLNSADPFDDYYVVFFMLMLAVCMAVYALVFGSKPELLSKIAYFTTPAACVITAVFAYLPLTLRTTLYIASPIFAAPLIVRRLYGVINSARSGRRLMRYISAYALSVILFAACFLVFSDGLVFIVPTLALIPAWLGIRRTVKPPEELPKAGTLKLSPKMLLLLAAVIVLLFWVCLTDGWIHSYLIVIGTLDSILLYILLGFLIPPLASVLYAVISDKGYERLALVCAMCLSIASMQFAYMPDNSVFLLPMAFASGIGGNYAEFLVMTIPIFFFTGSKRPVFISSLGIIIYMVFAAIIWGLDPMVLGMPLIISSVLSSIVFVFLVWFLFERQKEKSLASALYAILHRNSDAEQNSVMSETSAAMNELLTPEEIDVAILLIGGETRYAISRKLNLPVADIGRKMDAIRDKVIRKGDPNPGISAAVREFKLTPRETDTLRCLIRSMTNADIAAELNVEEDTIRKHVRSLLAKLPVDDRKDVPELIASLEGR